MRARCAASWRSATRSPRRWCAAGSAIRRGHGPSCGATSSTTPAAFAGIGEAVASDRRATSRGAARITVHGDYDVDGVCSTAVLVHALRRLGADVDWYLPDRAGDGYGLNAATVRAAGRPRHRAAGERRLRDRARSRRSQQALRAGPGRRVTDHHSPRADGVLPRAPIVHPAVCGYPCRELCATAVAYKLAQALYADRGRDPRELEARARPGGAATIADVVPLLGENRTLAVRGLRAPGEHRQARAAGADGGRRGSTPGRVDERAVASRWRRG